jgi:hypothetical protein
MSRITMRRIVLGAALDVAAASEVMRAFCMVTFCFLGFF